jgi:hypothetical protein
MTTAPAIAFAAVLALSSALAILVSMRARRSARDYLNFAAALYVALAFAEVLSADFAAAELAQTVALIVAALAPASLALVIASVFERPPSAIIATPVLLLACLAGFAAAATGEAFIAFAPLAASACAMLALSARHARLAPRGPAQACVSAIALLAGAAAFNSGGEGQMAFALFSAVAILGVSLAATRKTPAKISDRAVEQEMPGLDLRVGRQS